MSLCVAAVDKSNNTVVIATESLALWEDFTKELGHKFVEYYACGVTVAYAGSTRYAQIAERLMREHRYFTNGFGMAPVKKLATDLQQACKEENEEALSSSQLLLVCKGESYILEIDTDYAVHKHKSWATIGSGGNFGEIALEALADVDISVKERVQAAMKAVCAHRTDCGGKVHVKEV